MATERTKPAKLQLNNSGAWKDVVHFDADDTEQTDAVTDAAEALGRVPGNRLTFRLVKDDGTAEVLMHWTAEHDWVARNA
jgi:hypothetical protein